MLDIEIEEVKAKDDEELKMDIFKKEDIINIFENKNEVKTDTSPKKKLLHEIISRRYNQLQTANSIASLIEHINYGFDREELKDIVISPPIERLNPEHGYKPRKLYEEFLSLIGPNMSKLKPNKEPLYLRRGEENFLRSLLICVKMD